MGVTLRDFMTSEDVLTNTELIAQADVEDT